MIFKFLEFLQSIKKLILWIAHYTIQLLYINLYSLVCHNMLMVGEVVVVVVSHVHCVSAKTRLISVRQTGESEPLL